MNIARRLQRYLLTGILVLAPLSISLFLLFSLVTWVDRLLSPAAVALLGHDVPGLGLATAAGLLVGAGWLGSNVIGRHVVEAVEDMVLRVPFLNMVFRTV